ncbi:MAG: PEGA domain-containing protein [Myxococcaceae bacterium]|nr:PEGA domain-containing protein [Myxococcaceae bacterium]
MSALDEAIAACRARDTQMPPPLAAWLVARETESARFDQGQLGQALIDLMGSPGPEPLGSIVARMLSPNLEHRYPVDGVELRKALYDFSKLTTEVAKGRLADFMQTVAKLPQPRDSGEWLTGRPALDASGRVVAKATAPGTEVPTAAFEPPKAAEGELELARPARRPPNEWSEPAPYRDEVARPRSRAGVIAVAVLAVLGLAAVGAFMFVPTLQRKLPVDLPLGMAKGSLVVTSTPEGASVVVDGKVVGTTPFAADNRWSGRPKLELRLAGYETFRDSFEGNTNQSIAATLKKK